MNFVWAAWLTTVTVTVTTPQQTASPQLEMLTIETNIVRHTNAQRVQYGLPPLQIDTHLMRSARRHAIWMARNRMLHHTSAVVAENIATGQSSSQEAVMDWMSSVGHRANILSRGHGRIGVAAYRGRDGRIYWCQQFLQ